MITRTIEASLVEALKSFNCVSIIGPRQSGKTTLVKKLFKDFSYINLENPDLRQIAREDPRGLIEQHQNIIFDEAQRLPELFSYIQTYLDESDKKIIITGSNQLELNAKISQSLAGRTAIFKLLPLSLEELATANINQDVASQILSGFYPAIYDRVQEPSLMYRSYFETYLQKDVRQILNISDMTLFERFIRLCAGRIANLLNFSNLSNELGVSVNTLQSWFSVLEASFICFRLSPFHANIGKRLIKASKLYFYDVGLVSYLLGIREENQIQRDPLRGALFENLLIAEFVKQRYNQGKDHRGFFFRDSNGVEVDYLSESREGFEAFEIKSSVTYNSAFKKNLEKVEKLDGINIRSKSILYAGKSMLGPSGINIRNYHDFFSKKT